MSTEAWTVFGVIVAVAAYAFQFGVQWAKLRATGELVVQIMEEIKVMRERDLAQIQDRLAAQGGMARIEARLDSLPCASRSCPLPED